MGNPRKPRILTPWHPAVMDRLVPNGDCLEWPKGASRDRRGYGMVSGRLDGDSAKTMLRVARLVVAWSEGLDPRDGSWVARHSCDNPPCCNRAHLRSGTVRENVDDMLECGRSNAGQRNSRSRLTTSQVEEIRLQRAAGTPRAEVAKAFGIHPGHVSAITSRRFWK